MQTHPKTSSQLKDCVAEVILGKEIACMEIDIAALVDMKGCAEAEAFYTNKILAMVHAESEVRRRCLSRAIMNVEDDCERLIEYGEEIANELASFSALANGTSSKKPQVSEETHRGLIDRLSAESKKLVEASTLLAPTDSHVANASFGGLNLSSIVAMADRLDGLSASTPTASTIDLARGVRMRHLFAARCFREVTGMLIEVLQWAATVSRQTSKRERKRDRVVANMEKRLASIDSLGMRREENQHQHQPYPEYSESIVLEMNIVATAEQNDADVDSGSNSPSFGDGTGEFNTGNGKVVEHEEEGLSIENATNDGDAESHATGNASEAILTSTEARDQTKATSKTRGCKPAKREKSRLQKGRQNRPEKSDRAATAPMLSGNANLSACEKFLMAAWNRTLEEGAVFTSDPRDCGLDVAGNVTIVVSA